MVMVVMLAVMLVVVVVGVALRWVMAWLAGAVFPRPRSTASASAKSSG